MRNAMIRCFAGISTLFATTTAVAHHVMDGQMPVTFVQGLLSGFGHPIIGFDHLAFVIAVGLLALKFSHRYLLPLFFVAATLLGAGIHLLAVDLPAVELTIALSVIVLGVLIFSQASLSILLAGALFAFAGLFHGYAYGESIIGAEQAPMLAYMLGFALIQYLIAALTTLIAQRFTDAGRLSLPLRIGGLAISAVGIVFLMQNLS